MWNPFNRGEGAPQESSPESNTGGQASASSLEQKFDKPNPSLEEVSNVPQEVAQNVETFERARKEYVSREAAKGRLSITDPVELEQGAHSIMAEWSTPTESTVAAELTSEAGAVSHAESETSAPPSPESQQPQG